MAIELNEEETGLVKELLQAALGELMAEIRHTETNRFRQMLQEREDLIRELLAKL